jgi:hypothetical protein
VPTETPAISDLLTVRPWTLGASDVAAATNSAAAELKPRDGAMVRAVWYDEAGAAGQLLLVVHHLVIDGVSWRILTDDLARAWAQVRDGDGTRRVPTLDDVPTSFRTWSDTIAAARFDTEVEQWNQVLATADPNLGRRAIDPLVDTANTVDSLAFSLPAEVSSALVSSVPAAFHGGVNDVLLTALALALAQWRAGRGDDGSTATIVNLEGHGREADLLPGHLDLSRTIGWFTAIYPARIDPGRLDWADVLVAGPGLATAAKSVK